MGAAVHTGTPRCLWWRERPAFCPRHSPSAGAVGARDLRPCRAGRVHVTYTSDRGQIDVAELADLVAQCATFAPGQALDAEGDDDDRRRPSTPLRSRLRNPKTLNPKTLNPKPSTPLRSRLRNALRNSMECVAAYAAESSLPAHQHLSSRGLCGRPELRWWAAMPGLGSGRRVLVGFARAVGDAALVATVHDVLVMPELRGRGIGAALMHRLTAQLYRREVIDVGVLAPTDTEGFFEECGFGDDTEASVVMMLAPAAATELLERGHPSAELLKRM